MRRKRDNRIALVLVAMVLTLLVAHLLLGAGWLPASTGEQLIKGVERVPTALAPYIQPRKPLPTPWFVPKDPPLQPRPPEPIIDPYFGPEGDNFIQLHTRSEARLSLYTQNCDYSNDRRKMFALDYEFFFVNDQYTVRSYEHRNTDDCGYQTLYLFPWWLQQGQHVYVSIKSEGHLVKYMYFSYTPNWAFYLYPMRGGDSETGEGTWNLVDTLDFNSLVYAFGNCITDPNYRRRDDFNWDRCVDSEDFQQIQMNFGTEGDPTVCQVWPCSSAAAVR